MFNSRWAVTGLVVFTLFFLVSVLEIDAWARAGGGRSFGSRGARTYSAPRATPAPAPASPSQGARQFASPAAPAPAPSPLGGGFLRSMAGGLIGGMLGGMLFRSLGFAGGGAGGFGGGIGLMDIVLIGALLYGVFWFIKRRRTAEEFPRAGGNSYRETAPPDLGRTAASFPAAELPPQESDVATGLGHIRQMDPRFDGQRFTDGCMDHFFRIQGAWANRDMSGVRNLLSDEMYAELQREAEQLKARGQINRLDNIAVRSVDITEAWQEGGADFITVRLYANLLDYTIDEKTGQVVAGNRTEPVKFTEYWTFTRPVGDNPWRLSAIHQSE